MRKALTGGIAGMLLLVLAPAAPADHPPGQVGGLLARIKAVGKEGAGNVEAQKAWRELVRSGPEALPAILAAWDDHDPIAANWLRTAVDAIAECALAGGQPLPAASLEAFVRQTRHAGPARRLAFEWLARVDPSAPGRLLPGMLQDPSAELRRDAVALVLKGAQERLDRGDRPGATAAYRKGLDAARDHDQVEQIAQRLKSLGVEVDLAAHFGFIRDWMLLGPFDNHGGAGFAAVYPPEKEVDLAGTYPGKDGAALHWVEHTTTDREGVVDLNKVMGKQHGSVVYAFAAVLSPVERPVQVRAGSDNAVKIFLNGRLILSREEYHHGRRVDQHTGAGTLREGRNEVLIKVCQNEQTEDWAQAWAFQLRVCDEVGGGVHLTVIHPNKVEASPAKGEVRR